MMKKVFFALAVAGMFGFAACGNNNTEVEDTTAMEAIEATEEVVDTNAVEAAVEEVAPEATEEAAQ